MKILILTPQISHDKWSQFAQSPSGLGYMVYDIANGVGEDNTVELLSRERAKGEVGDHFEVLNHEWADVWRTFSIKWFVKGLIAACGFGLTFRDRLRLAFHYTDTGCAQKVIKDFCPDVVHIHGIVFSTKPYIDLCKELHVPYVVTLHGLNGLNDEVKIHAKEKQLERDFLIESEKKNIPVTVVSHGVKKRIHGAYGLTSGENVRVITNGTDIGVKDATLDVRKKYDIPRENRIILCIGNLCDRKNQTQLVDAYHAIPESIRKKTTVLFLGNDLTDGVVRERTKILGHTDNLICCGHVSREDIPSYFQAASLNVVASKDEGFGLSMIEGFVYGIPTVTFADLDAVEDIYDESATLLVQERSTAALADGIVQALERDWDAAYIRKHSEKFSLKVMSERYGELYKRIHAETTFTRKEDS